jgi:Leucine-rich repeat (LRR) protein
MPINPSLALINQNTFRALRITRTLIAFSFGLIALIGNVRAAIPDAERAVLASLFTRTQGDNWINKDSWNGAPGTECAWHGVACNADGSHVIEVVLSGNNLVGLLPITINQLSALKKFDLHSNELTGAIPSITGLSSLSFFSVANNQIRGTIPALSNQGLNELATYVVAGNRLTGTIPSLSGLTKLTEFNASDNQLTGSMPSLDGLSALAQFNVSGNQLSGAIAEPPSPSALIVGGSSLCPNQLRIAADAAWDLATPNATWDVGCVGQRLQQTLSFLGPPVLTLANGLHPSGTVSATVLPTDASTEPTVFTSLTPEICAATTFAGVGIVTVTPEAALGDICTITADKAADISFNSAAQRQQQITISTELDPTDLAVLLALYDGTGGDSWLLRDHWKDTAFHPCEWFGIFCAADRTHVTSIVLNSNRLSGALPRELNQLRELRHVSVNSNNRLSGTIPSLAGLTKLLSFSAIDTAISESIPSLSALSALEEFDVSSSNIVGPLPSLSGLTHLKRFKAAVNFGLRGSIPSLTGLIALEEFDVSRSQLSGRIPAIAGLPALRIFDVSENSLSGPVPELIDLPALAFFRVNKNKLTGTIPAIDGLPAIQITLFGDNELKGAIPAFPTTSTFFGGSLCPNQLTVVVSPEWDAGTLTTPWNRDCTAPLIDQTLSFGPPPRLRVGGRALTIATVNPSPGSSGGVEYESLTQNVCLIRFATGELVARAGAVAGDVCTYTADKRGDAAFNTAPQIEQSIIIQAVGATTFNVTPSTADANGFIQPNIPQTVTAGDTASFVSIPNAGFNIASVGGTCGGALTGNSYTTNPITADCTVIASFVAVTSATFTVTPSTTDTNGTINPNTPQIVASGSTATFSITPNAGFTVSGVDGSCGGTLSVGSFTTNPVTADCTLILSFVAVSATTFTVTPNATDPNGAIAPNAPQTIASGDTTTFSITPNAGFFIAGVTGTCGGVLTGSRFTTNAISADCTVNPSFALIPVAAEGVAVPTLSQWALMLLALLAIALAVRAHGVQRLAFRSC